MTVASQEAAGLYERLAAVASVSLLELAARPCTSGSPHRWIGKSGKRKKCKRCGLTDFRGALEPKFDLAEHRAAVRHAIQTGQVLA